MPGGRPSSYDPEHCKWAQKLCALGATVRDVADFFEISVQTLYNWGYEHPEFMESLKVGKQEADERVQQSLYRRATGYTFDSVKIFPPRMTEDGPSEPIVVPYVEHVPPDTTACIFWLKNRQAKDWRDKNHVEHSGTVTLESLITGSGSEESK